VAARKWREGGVRRIAREAEGKDGNFICSVFQLFYMRYHTSHTALSSVQ